MSSHGSGCDTDCTSNAVKEADLKPQLEGNFFSLSFDSVDLCLPLSDCHQGELHIRKGRVASESSTIFDTCSSTSSSTVVSNPASNHFTTNSDKCSAMDHIIDYKPIVGSPTQSEIASTHSENAYYNHHNYRALLADGVSQLEEGKQREPLVLNPMSAVSKFKAIRTKRPSASSNPSREVLSDGINLVRHFLSDLIFVKQWQGKSTNWNEQNEHFFYFVRCEKSL